MLSWRRAVERFTPIRVAEAPLNRLDGGGAPRRVYFYDCAAVRIGDESIAVWQALHITECAAGEAGGEVFDGSDAKGARIRNRVLKDVGRAGLTIVENEYVAGIGEGVAVVHFPRASRALGRGCTRTRATDLPNGTARTSDFDIQIWVAITNCVTVVRLVIENRIAVECARRV